MAMCMESAIAEIKGIADPVLDPTIIPGQSFIGQVTCPNCSPSHRGLFSACFNGCQDAASFGRLTVGAFILPGFPLVLVIHWLIALRF